MGDELMDTIHQPDSRRLAVRIAAYGLILHGLLERLALAGIISGPDVDAIEQFAVTIADELAAHGSTEAQVNGARVATEIRNYMGALR